jgi:hypothetical protein
VSIYGRHRRPYFVANQSNNNWKWFVSLITMRIIIWASQRTTIELVMIGLRRRTVNFIFTADFLSLSLIAEKQTIFLSLSRKNFLSFSCCTLEFSSFRSVQHIVSTPSVSVWFQTWALQDVLIDFIVVTLML